jgi:hypothetical protein
MFDFGDCLTIAEVKAKFKRYAFQVHPDLHPADQFAKWNEAMQVLNSVYLHECQKRDGERYDGDDQREHVYKYNRTTEETLAAAVARAARAKLPDYVTVSVVGIYVWVEGTRKEDAECRRILKGDGEDKPADRFFWHSKRMAWYWKPPSYRARYNRSASLDDLKSYYGSTTVEKEDNAPLTLR